MLLNNPFQGVVFIRSLTKAWARAAVPASGFLVVMMPSCVNPEEKVMATASSHCFPMGLYGCILVAMFRAVPMANHRGISDPHETRYEPTIVAANSEAIVSILADGAS